MHFLCEIDKTDDVSIKCNVVLTHVHNWTTATEQLKASNSQEMRICFLLN